MQKHQPDVRSCNHPLLKRRENTYPAKALHADIIGVRATGRPINNSIPQLVIRRISCHSAEELASILHQDWGQERGKPEARYPNTITPMLQSRRQVLHHPCHLLPLYLGTQRTFVGSPLMLKCFPSKSAHCSSRKSFFSFEHGSVLQDLNFMRRPTQYFPPFLGLQKQNQAGNEMQPPILQPIQHSQDL